MSDRSNPYRMQSLQSASELYHEASKLRESDAVTARAVWSVNTSPIIKQTISKPATTFHGYPLLRLPEPSRLDRAFTDVLLGRHSTRTYGGQPLSRHELSALLYYGAGVTRRETDSHGIVWGFRIAPSGGALYPIDIHCISLRIDDVKQGLYSYDPSAHALQLLAPGAFAERLSTATYLPETIDTAAVCIVMTANFARTKFKYGERGYRFALLEAGHIAQNLLLAAEALGLGALPLGGYVDDQLNALVGAEGCEQAVVYAVIVGCCQA